MNTNTNTTRAALDVALAAAFLTYERYGDYDGALDLLCELAADVLSDVDTDEAADLLTELRGQFQDEALG